MVDAGVGPEESCPGICVDLPHRLLSWWMMEWALKSLVLAPV